MAVKTEMVRPLIAIPAYNEERNIAALLSRLHPWKNDVIVIDDGSTDRTASLVKNLGFDCFSNKVNLGLSGFYSTAGKYALEHGYTHIIALDADGQHEPDHIPEFIGKLHQFELVSGDRFHDLNGIPESKIASNLFAILLFREILGISLPDVACGFRGVHIDAIPEGHDSARFGIIYEMLAKHALAGKPIGLVRIGAIYRPGTPMNTNIPEILGLLSVVRKYSADRSVAMVMESVMDRKEFRMDLSGFEFRATFEPPGAYLFRTELLKARDFLNSIH
ncbi:MAG: glycosyltransferase family 2 protein [bacterium]